MDTTARFPVVVHHNPNCGTSRKVIGMVRDAGIEPVIVEYMKTGWTRGQLQALLAIAGASARDFLRDKEALVAELGLKEADPDPAVDEERILEAMVAHPVLVNRPIVASPSGVALCRPAEAVQELLP